MAEKYEAFKRFEYRENSSLVLQRERAPPPSNEPSGEAETLARQALYPMGDKVMKMKRGGEEIDRPSKRRRGRISVTKGATVLDEDIEDRKFYTPTTKVNQMYFENLMSLIASKLGDVDSGVLKDAAEEVLEAVHTEQADTDTRTAVLGTIGPLTDSEYGKILRLAKDIDDYGETQQSNETAADDAGLVVIFDEDDVEENFESESDDSEKSDDQGNEAIEMRSESESEGNADTGVDLPAGSIHAYWLQRELNKFVPDLSEVQTLERQILACLADEDTQSCENALVMLLKYENFSFAKLLLNNRWSVYYLTRLGQSQSEESTRAIISEMESSPEGRKVLGDMEASGSSKDREKLFARTMRQEAATLQEKQPRPAHEEEAADAAPDSTLPRETVDLESLMFPQGAHLMANEVVKVPEGSQRVVTKLYDEVSIPAVRNEAGAVKLKPIASLPTWARPAFTCVDITHLNPVQSKVCDFALSDSNNMLLCAPTGAGKTNVAVLCMLNAMSQCFLPNGRVDLTAFRVVYISPMKALVAEQVQTFSKRFSSYGVKVHELTGDVSMSRSELEETNIIVTTPEKWDVITRKVDQRTLTQLVKLIVIDEIHLLHDARGPVIEALVARSIRRMESTQTRVRLVGLSATLPNYEDVAVFMRVSLEENRGLFVFGNHFRPVPLQQTYIGVKCKKGSKKMNAMNQVCYEKVMACAGKNQVLIFTHSRKETARTAKAVVDLATEHELLGSFLGDGASREILQAEVDNCKTPELAELLAYGFGIHHAGMPREDRSLVEALFADGHIQVLVSTATLAWGVNLPAHTVLIKGTSVYSPEKGSWQELSPMDVMQMMGRAGRPQYDADGHGVIITMIDELQYYMSLNNQQLPIESQMMSLLPDVINAEVVSGSIRSRAGAVRWLAYTYLYVRMLRNPKLYGADPDSLTSDPTLEQRRVDLAHSVLVLLDRHNLLKYDRRSGQLQVTALGRVASHYYIRHQSMRRYNEHLSPEVSDVDLLRIFALSREFEFMPVRDEEKVEVVKLLEKVPIPVKGGVDESLSKVNVLLQAYISRMSLEGYAINSDLVYVRQSAGRIMRALFEICLKRGWASAASRCLKFCKMIDHRVWSCMCPLRQLKVLPDLTLKRLESRDISWRRFYDLTPSALGELVRDAAMGKKVHRWIHSFPRLELSAAVQPVTRTCLSFELTVLADFVWDRTVHGYAQPFWVFVLDTDGEQILHSEFFVVKESHVTDGLVLDFVVPIQSDVPPPNYFINVVSDKWLGADTTLTVPFTSLILPQKNPPHTHLLGMQLLPVSALKLPKAEVLYSHVDTFNPIQTQAFPSFYLSDANAVLCAAPNSGKQLCAEFAVLRTLQHGPEGRRRCVCLLPHAHLVDARLRDWKQRLEPQLGVVVTGLTDDLMQNLAKVQAASVIVCTPSCWDVLSRRWRTRKAIQKIGLLIVEHVHQLSDPEEGGAMEVCVSRTRYMAAQLSTPIRIVAFGVSLTNAKDVLDWVGGTAENLFNFAPVVRPTSLEVSIQGFDIHHRDSRLMAMLRPTYMAIETYSPISPVLVFVPDRKQVRVASTDLLLMAAADDRPDRFLKVSQAQIDETIALFGWSSSALGVTLRRGVGFIHEGFTSKERTAVEELFRTGAIQVLFLTQPLHVACSLTASLVVIQDTSRFDGHLGKFVDFPVHETLSMIGRASSSEGGRTLLLCAGARKEFYKRFIFESIPVESCLDSRIADYMNAEISLKTIENKQDAVDWLTWTFYYRRLGKNPNFYGLSSVGPEQLADHLSGLVESACETLATAQCIAVEGEMDLSPLNLGLISAFYNIRTFTIELFNKSVSSNTKKKTALEMIAAASEFERLPIRSGEDQILSQVTGLLNLSLPEGFSFSDCHSKALILLYAHLNRSQLTSDLQKDKLQVVQTAARLIQGLVDVVASNGWLRAALSIMELSQMTVQAIHSAKPECSLLQLPFANEEFIADCRSRHVEDMSGFIEMDDQDRQDLLEKHFSDAQIAQLAGACNRYPMLSVLFHAIGADDVSPDPEDLDNRVFAVDVSTEFTITVTLEKDGDEAGPVFASYFPVEKDEQWWALIGNSTENTLLAIKKVTAVKTGHTVKLCLESPDTSGDHPFGLFVMSDCYVGCDQEFQFTIRVR
ncbi:MAG: uncharacterized protein KVP18_003020 [Porospora cf. gigantea A]|uniref:uncharacterized protein n=1 Tax=Porospora cf. gigantea A TaxID=2853593 RepID=UPI003559F8C4|nr:MAG: hypothetical protein KVP18_003020 [Porospora cf. gigantea A]